MPGWGLALIVVSFLVGGGLGAIDDEPEATLSQPEQVQVDQQVEFDPNAEPLEPREDKPPIEPELLRGGEGEVVGEPVEPVQKGLKQPLEAERNLDEYSLSRGRNLSDFVRPGTPNFEDFTMLASKTYRASSIHYADPGANHLVYKGSFRRLKNEADRGTLSHAKEKKEYGVPEAYDAYLVSILFHMSQGVFLDLNLKLVHEDGSVFKYCPGFELNQDPVASHEARSVGGTVLCMYGKRIDEDARVINFMVGTGESQTSPKYIEGIDRVY